MGIVKWIEQFVSGKAESQDIKVIQVTPPHTRQSSR